MKKIAIVMLALVCAGCTKRTGDAGNGMRGLWVYQDAETGCEYVAQHVEGGLSARIDSDGHTHRGCKNGGQK